MKHFILFFIVVVSGCSVSVEKSEQPKMVYVSVPLDLPAKPAIPKISSDGLVCVDDQTKMELLHRDAIIKTYIQELETIITSTHKK